jgi:hypothetical protein
METSCWVIHQRLLRGDELKLEGKTGEFLAKTAPKSGA